MKLFYADCETTGLDCKKNEAVQIAYLITVDGKVLQKGNLFLRPEKLDCIDDYALKIQGKTKEDLLKYPSRREGYKDLTIALGKYCNKFDKQDKFYWVGQNAPFDMGFVRALFEEQGDKYFGSWFYYPPLELMTLAMACKMLGLAQFPNFKLATLAQVMGVALGEDAHDAVMDIQATRQVFNKLLVLLKGNR